MLSEPLIICAANFHVLLLCTLRVEVFAIIKCCGRDYSGTYFCDFGPKPQKLDPQNTVWMTQPQNQVLQSTVWKPIAKINSTFSSKNFCISF